MTNNTTDVIWGICWNCWCSCFSWGDSLWCDVQWHMPNTLRGMCSIDYHVVKWMQAQTCNSRTPMKREPPLGEQADVLKGKHSQRNVNMAYILRSGKNFFGLSHHFYEHLSHLSVVLVEQLKMSCAQHFTWASHLEDKNTYWMSGSSTKSAMNFIDICQRLILVL